MCSLVSKPPWCWCEKNCCEWQWLVFVTRGMFDVWPNSCRRQQQQTIHFCSSIHPPLTLHSRTNTDTATMASIAKSSTASSTGKGFDAGSKLDPPTNALVNSLLTDMYQVQNAKGLLAPTKLRSSAHPLSFSAHTHTHTRLQCHMPTGRVASTMIMPCLTCSFARIHSRASLQSLVAWRRCVLYHIAYLVHAVLVCVCTRHFTSAPLPAARHHQVCRHVDNFSFSAEQVEYVKSLMPHADAGFFEYLSKVDCAGIKVYAIDEGSVVFPREAVIRIEGPLAVAQLLETTLLCLCNYASLMATNAARFRQAAGDDKALLEFGLRRAQGPDGAMSASRYSYLGGFDGTSNVLAGHTFGITPKGTHAHAFVSSFTGLADVAVQCAGWRRGAREPRPRLTSLDLTTPCPYDFTRIPC